MCLNQMKPHRSDSWSAGHVSLTSPRWLQEALEWLRCGAQRSTRMTIRERCHPAALKINVALEQFFLQGSCKEKWGVPESSPRCPLFYFQGSLYPAGPGEGPGGGSPGSLALNAHTPVLPPEVLACASLCGSSDSGPSRLSVDVSGTVSAHSEPH